MKGNGYFGEWIIDKFGLPAYNYTCNQLIDPIAKTPTSYGVSTDHFHQLGNDRIMATAHNGGYVQFFDGSRGFKWLTYKDIVDGKLGGGIGLYSFEKERESLSDLYSLDSLDKTSQFERIFGVGYFQKRLIYKDTEILHTICTPFSDDPIILSEYVVTPKNNTSTNTAIKLLDFWDLNLHPIKKSLIVTWNKRKKFGLSKLFNFTGRLVTNILTIFKRDTENSRRALAAKFSYTISYLPELNTLVLTPKYNKSPRVAVNESAKTDYYPKSFFLTILNHVNVKFFIDKTDLFKENEISIDWLSNLEIHQINRRNLCLSAGISINLNEFDNQKLFTLFGYEDLSKIEGLVKKYQKITSNNSILEWNAQHWKNSIINLNLKEYDHLSRETIWHSYYTRSALFYDEYYKYHRLYQGSVYLFGHGLDGSIRDYVLFLNSLILLNPKHAREFLLFIVSLIFKGGKIPYALHGFGKTSSAFVHSKPSDLYLFILWGIEQYVSLTRDYEILEEFIPFYDKPNGVRTKVSERIKILITYLFSEKVGFGEHGLIKCNDGDWSDGISLMVKSRRKFIKYGESSFNSSFALYILPKVLNLIKNPKKQFIDSCLEKLESLQHALFNSYNGKWFYRGWDGQGNPIGDKSLYLEHHTWILISSLLDNEKANKLIEQIFELLDIKSPIGQYLCYPTQKTQLNILPEGWDINGGIWHAMNALLTWGYSKYDEEKALNSLIKNSLATRAEVYPNIWYGIWSAPDSYIADYARNAGEAFYHFATPMCDFPIMNLNAHATYLLSIIKIAGIEADISGLIIDPHIMSEEFIFNSPLISIDSDSEKFSITYNVETAENYKIKIKIPKWWNTGSRIHLNDLIANEQVEFDNNFVIINIPANFGSVVIKLIK